MPRPKQEPKPLCFRCEHRAAAHETGDVPRFECGELGQAVHACYMYRPVEPLALLPIAGERRSLRLPAAFAGRANGYEAPGLKLYGAAGKVNRRKALLKYWGPADK